MDRRKRRFIKRLKARLAKEVNVTEPSKPASPAHIENKPVPTQQSPGISNQKQRLSRTKKALSFALAVLGFLGGYALFSPHVSIQPSKLLNTADPFSALFSVKNDNVLFSVNNFISSCRTILVLTDRSDNVAYNLFVSPTVATIGPLNETTTQCPSVVSQAGHVTKAFVEFEVSMNKRFGPLRKML